MHVPEGTEAGTKSETRRGSMAQKGQKDMLARLADAGEEALTRLAQSPGAERVLGVMTNMRDQVDALGTRVRGLEGLEKRVNDLEREVRKLSKPSTAASGSRSGSSSTARKTSSSSTARRSSGSTKKS